MSKPDSIESEIAELPPNLRAEVLDFVQFVKQRHGLPAMTREPAAVSAAPATGDSSLFQALSAAGFVGCIETNEQLASAYKNRFNFAAKLEKPASIPQLVA